MKNLAMKNLWKISLLAGLVLPVASACRRDAGKEARAASGRNPVARSDEARRREEVAARVRATLQDRTHFAFDRADINAAAQRTLQAKVGLLRADSSIRLQIEGHADERGTEAYNQRLGLRRAEAVKRLLTAAGVPAARLETVSYGETRPVEPGHNERAWAANRRAEFRILSGPMGGAN